MLSHVQKSIERIQNFAPVADQTGGYFVAYSGGKDSEVILELCKMAGVKFDAHYSHTTVDPPELVAHIKTKEGVIIDWPTWNGERISMWSLIVRKRMPPTRLVRYCCEKLKEGGGDGRFVITGVRWAESSKRKNSRSVVEANNGSKSKNPKRVFMLNSENDEARRMIEACAIRSKHVLNPIVDWSDEQVWAFIREREIKYCSLYDEGFTRLGCIACPMSGKKGMERDFARWPKYEALYEKAFDRMLAKRRLDGLDTKWNAGTEVMAWWKKGR